MTENAASHFPKLRTVRGLREGVRVSDSSRWAPAPAHPGPWPMQTMGEQVHTRAEYLRVREGQRERARLRGGLALHAQPYLPGCLFEGPEC